MGVVLPTPFWSLHRYNELKCGDLQNVGRLVKESHSNGTENSDISGFQKVDNIQLELGRLRHEAIPEPSCRCLAILEDWVDFQTRKRSIFHAD